MRAAAADHAPTAGLAGCMRPVVAPSSTLPTDVAVSVLLWWPCRSPVQLNTKKF
jgi:hypothetical protein